MFNKIKKIVFLIILLISMIAMSYFEIGGEITLASPPHDISKH